MMLAHKLSIDELHVSESALPLDNLDQNIFVRDALVTGTGSRSEWPKADVIIGNPPFLGAKLMKDALGPEYVKSVRRAYPEVPGMADYCVYWLRRAHDELPEPESPSALSGRAGLVGTQNIRSNQSRVGGLDHVVRTGTVLDVVDSQPWSGEANVNVSIVNWIKTKDSTLLPATRRLWFKVSQSKRGKSQHSTGPAHKVYDLDMRVAGRINADLTDKVDVTGAGVLSCNRSPRKVFQGQTPGHKGFLLKPAQYKALISNDESSATVMHQFVGGDQVLNGTPLPHRYIVDFEQKTVIEAAKFKAAFAHVQQLVLPTREKSAQKGVKAGEKGRSHHEHFLSRWWQLSWGRADLLTAISGLTRYMVCSRHTKRPIFAFVSSDVRPGDALQVFAFDDDYSFGILQASMHQQWFIAKSSKLTERLRYTPDSIFDTFPWPQAPSAPLVEKVAAAARELRLVQHAGMAGTKGGLRTLYKTFELPGTSPLKDAHSALDAAVLEAYAFKAGADPLAQLLQLNKDIAASLASGKKVQGPGVPATWKGAALVSKDCLGGSSSM